MRRKALEIKKKIIEILKKHGEMSLRDLETKANTNNKTIKTQIEELEWFGKVIVLKHNKNEKNGGPYTSIKISSK